MMNAVAVAPTVGVGLSYLAADHDHYLDYRADIDFLELPSDTFVRRLAADPTFWRPRLEQLTDAFPVVAHGICLGLADPRPARCGYLDALAAFCDLVEPLWFSDHLDQASVEADEPLPHGIPIPFTPPVADRIRRNMAAAACHIGRSLLAENTWYDFIIPLPDRMTEPAFLQAVFDDTEHGLLLDVTNLALNAANYGFDAHDWLANAPIERTVEIHVAGSEQLEYGPRAGRWIDTHSRPVPDDVWQLVEAVVARASVRAIVVERTVDVPPMADLVAELRIARQILTAHSTKQTQYPRSQHVC